MNVVITSLSLSLSLLSSPLQKPLTDSCAEDYPGPKALSELETQHIVNFFRQNAPIVGAIDWHSYGQLILRPWGYTNATAPDEDWHKKLSTEMANIIRQVSKYCTFTKVMGIGHAIIITEALLCKTLGAFAISQNMQKQCC